MRACGCVKAKSSSKFCVCKGWSENIRVVDGSMCVCVLVYLAGSLAERGVVCL